MGRGDRPTVRWAKDRQRKKKAAERRQAEERAEIRKESKKK